MSQEANGSPLSISIHLLTQQRRKQCPGARQLESNKYETAGTKMHPSRENVELSSEELVASE
jgi:hypothetical protein